MNESPVPVKYRYCGSKFPHPAHDKPQVGRPEVVYHCPGKLAE